MINPEGEEMNPSEIIRIYAFPVLAAISTLSLISASISLNQSSKALKQTSRSLEPISKWAEIQNECIEKTFRINGKNTRGLPSKVWSCNGGGE